jgi:ribonuclease P protein component
VARGGLGAFALGRRERLRGREFQALFRQKSRREERRSFIALWRAREGKGKVGFAVGRRIGNSVDRNRARRRLREAYRREQGCLAAGIDVVFVGRPAVLTRPFGEILGEMRDTLQSLSRGKAAARPS